MHQTEKVRSLFQKISCRGTLQWGLSSPIAASTHHFRHDKPLKMGETKLNTLKNRCPTRRQKQDASCNSQSCYMLDHTVYLLFGSHGPTTHTHQTLSSPHLSGCKERRQCLEASDKRARKIIHILQTMSHLIKTSSIVLGERPKTASGLSTGRIFTRSPMFTRPTFGSKSRLTPCLQTAGKSARQSASSDIKMQKSWKPKFLPNSPTDMFASGSQLRSQQGNNHMYRNFDHPTRLARKSGMKKTKLTYTVDHSRWSWTLGVPFLPNPFFELQCGCSKRH